MQNNDDLRQYEDIIHLPHHVSKIHPAMPVRDRAAQFAPFAALTGFGEAVKETARLTDARKELSESEQEELDVKLQLIQNYKKEPAEVCFTYFLPDGKKEGGQYQNVTGTVKKIDPYHRVIFLSDGTKIGFDDIVDIEIS